MAISSPSFSGSRIDLIASLEKDIVSIVGDERMLEFFKEVHNLDVHINNYYKFILSPDDQAKLAAILGKDSLLSDRLVELETFIKGKTVDGIVAECVYRFESEMGELLKEVLQVANKFNCRTAIELRDLDMLKALKKKDRDWYEGLLRMSYEYAKYGNSEEKQKSQAIVDWIQSEEPSWK